MSDLEDKLDNVVDRESFLEFVRALVADRVEKAKNEGKYPYGGQEGGWEHSTIGGYLEAALAWAVDSRHLPTGLASTPSWQMFATFLYMGKIYE